ncbi:GntP family permease [Sphingomonas psychrotolerans]|uniref:GntP family permease n=1 Tax=Sphingomonas psychrotolerans TaxID=1327635 RepID=A0ABU3N5P0_9SPHN|nr:gluconate:H+ symporter [Sphingomonas psychrotolerans]MDT8759852.1 GntP family permease [Sphingomonas psychrotolerans]
MPEPWYTMAIVAASIAAVIVLVLRFKLQPFLVLLLVALVTGLAFGGEPQSVIAAIRKGTGEALGFVAVVIGLGAVLGGLLEASGGVNAIAHRLLDLFGERRVPWALTAVGILVGVPLFFDVAFIILAPLLATLAIRAERRVTYFALPLLAGLMTMHALLPPHPGPVAVAELIHTDYGLLAFYGLICGIPSALIAGPIFAKLFHGAPGFGDQAPPPMLDEGAPQTKPIGFLPALLAMLFPLALILIAAVAGQAMAAGPAKTVLLFLGHPFTALMLAALSVTGWLRWREGAPWATLSSIMTRALEPAGLMVLIIGAGAAYKEVLIESGAGQQITALVTAAQVSVPVFAFLLAAFVRIAQGSATVAMVTAAGLAGPLITAAALSPSRIALVTIAIGGGATIASHVNDTGFWLVKQYLGLTEAQTFRSWTIGATIAGLTSFGIALLIWPFV